MSNEKAIAHYYRSFYMTRLLELDIKNLKRINNIYSKYLRTNRQSYIIEVVNILRTLNNNIFVADAKYLLLEYIDDKYKPSIIVLIDNLDLSNQQLMRDLLCIY